jgi:hypothetical protein
MSPGFRRAPPRRTKPTWERGYRSHGFWRGNLKLGSVRFAEPGEPRGRYVWCAQTQTGYAATLRDAKRAVEAAVLIGARQLALPLAADENTASPTASP